MVMYYTQSNVLYPIVGTTGQVKSQNYMIVPLQWVDAHTQRDHRNRKCVLHDRVGAVVSGKHLEKRLKWHVQNPDNSDFFQRFALFIHLLYFNLLKSVCLTVQGSEVVLTYCQAEQSRL